MRLFILGATGKTGRALVAQGLVREARTLLRHTAKDQRAMEKLVTQSELEWTVLRPALLSDGVLTGRYAVSPASAAIPESRAGMSREDVAHMMLDAVECGAYVKEIVSLRGARA